MQFKFYKYLYITILLITALSNPVMAEQSVVIYTSVDQIFSEPILKEFEKASGINVKAVYDVEASKTVGLEKRLIAEKSRPKADIFWNSEYLRTLRLKKAGVLDTYTSEQIADIPHEYISPSKHWAGFGIRARVFVVNTDMVSSEDIPKKLEDLTELRWKGKAAIARPYFGTTSTHFAALYVKWGKEKYIGFLKALKANKVAVLPGNSNVRDAVVQGRYAFGLTDTDDVNVALQQKKPVIMVYPNQDAGRTFAIFHTLAKVAGGPNPETAQKLLDYLLSREVETDLLKSGAVQISVRPAVNSDMKTDIPQPKLWHIASEELLTALKPSADLVRQHLE